MSPSLKKTMLVIVSALLIAAGCTEEQPTDEVTQVAQASLPGEGGAGGASNCGNGSWNGQACDTDGDLCTLEVCQAGSCITDSPATVDCSGFPDPDTTDCLVPACEPTTGACAADLADRTEGTTCTSADDGFACTNEVCRAGVCTSENDDLSCNDAVSCTTNTCDPSDGAADANGCVFPTNDAACDDGISCTTNTCDPSDGSADANGCVFPTNDAACNDSFSCTADSCDPSDGNADPTTGCLFAPVNVRCDDGATCTAEFCDPGNAGANGAGCVITPNSAVCDDGATCTTDLCEPSGAGADATTGCIVSPNNSVCGDGEFCTADACSPGAPGANGTTGCLNDGTPRNGIPCSDGIGCTDDVCGSGSCNSTPVDSRCNDSKDCTTDSCSAVTGCVFDPAPLNGSLCDDGLTCTVDDRCDAAGDCVPGTPDNSLCPQAECAVGVCQPGGCALDASLKLNDPCRPATTFCDVAEVCDGFSNTCPANVFKGPVECSPASCAGEVQTDAVMCTGVDDVCAAPTVVNCNGYACDGGSPSVCRTSCSSDVDCILTSHFCDTSISQCVPRLSPGTDCENDTPCAQGDTCVDGVCCRDTCEGQCEACNIDGSRGVCTPIPAGEQPRPGGPVGASRSTCDGDGPATDCGGFCDGTETRRCSYPDTTTTCGPTSCDPATDIATLAALCNGAGSCLPATTVDCGSYRCNGNVCHTECTDDNQCEPDKYCTPARVCVDDKETGESCSTANECASGSCVDGVCCNGPCNNQCEACNLAGREGICSAVAGDPVGIRPACVGSGPCGGTCDGTTRTSCNLPNGNECRSAACSSGTASDASYCNGSGSCPASLETACPDGECNDALGICANAECQLDSDCESNQVCRAGVCVAEPEQGDACASDSECPQNLLCVDGVCCNSACLGQCEACDVSNSEGTCTAVPEGQLPRGARQACSSDGSDCGGTCDGTNVDACSYPTAQCQEPSCDSGTNSATLEAFCDGAGNCPGGQQSCSGLSCHPTAPACDGGCATDPNACLNTEYCSGGICLQKLENGRECGANGQCQSDICVDGVCCDNACTQQCEACNVTGSIGICSPVRGNARGFRGACGGSGECSSQCDGADPSECKFAGADEVCGLATCSAGVRVEESTCDGAGRCTPGEQVACPALLCSENTPAECATVCTDDTQCREGDVCRGGSCVLDPTIDGLDKGSCGCRIPGDPTPPSKGAPLSFLVTLLLIAARSRSRRQRHEVDR